MNNYHNLKIEKTDIKENNDISPNRSETNYINLKKNWNEESNKYIGNKMQYK